MLKVISTPHLENRAAWIMALELRDIFVAQPAAHVRRYGLHKDDFNLVITDSAEAMSRGKTLNRFSLGGNEGDVIDFLAICSWSLKKVLEVCASFNCEPTKHIRLRDQLKLWGYQRDAKIEFCPFAAQRVNPLQKLPAKWTIPHVVRLLARDTDAVVKTQWELTDDYKADADRNFGRDHRPDRLSLLRELVEGGRDWRIHEDHSGLSISHGQRSYAIDLPDRLIAA